MQIMQERRQAEQIVKRERAEGIVAGASEGRKRPRTIEHIDLTEI